jgi:hypothetical protein
MLCHTGCYESAIEQATRRVERRYDANPRTVRELIRTLSTEDAATFDRQHSICQRELATETAGPSAFSKQTVDSGRAYRRYVAANRRVDALRGSFLQAWLNVRIRVERQRHLRVAERLHYDARMHGGAWARRVADNETEGSEPKRVSVATRH